MARPIPVLGVPRPGTGPTTARARDLYRPKASFYRRFMQFHEHFGRQSWEYNFFGPKTDLQPHIKMRAKRPEKLRKQDAGSSTKTNAQTQATLVPDHPANLLRRPGPKYETRPVPHETRSDLVRAWTSYAKPNGPSQIAKRETVARYNQVTRPRTIRPAAIRKQPRATPGDTRRTCPDPPGRRLIRTRVASREPDSDLIGRPVTGPADRMLAYV